MVTTTLHGPGSDLTIETLAAKQIGSRAVLVAGATGSRRACPSSAPMDIYDVSDCARPRFLTTFTFPGNIHNLTISPDGNRVYATLPLQVVDIHDPAHPVFLGNLEDDIPQPNVLQQAGLPVNYLAHEVLTSPGGNILYLGGQTPLFDWFTIVDITGWPARTPEGAESGRGAGPLRPLATINGRKYVLHSEESIVGPTAKGCVPSDLNPFGGAAEPWLSDVTDPGHPRMRVSQMTLAINDPANCLPTIADGEDASVHYHDVDDPADTTFVMASMWNAGLRIFDVRHPSGRRRSRTSTPGCSRRRRTAGSSTRHGATCTTTRARVTSGSRRRAVGSGSSSSNPRCVAALGLPADPGRAPGRPRPRPADTRGVLSPRPSRRRSPTARSGP